MKNFAELGLRDELLSAIAELGFENPTPIQEQTIPLLIDKDQDFMGLAQTGTGKTAAFGLPLIQKVNPGKKPTSALVLAPTRELCVQITKDLNAFAKNTERLFIEAVYGGAPIDKQIGKLRKGVHIIVATPGRLIDLLERKAADLSQIQYVVLDEADEMLNMGFKEDIDTILEHTPSDKKTWLFSATMPAEVRQIAANYMNDPAELTVGKKNVGAENIEHVYYVVHARDRYEALKRIVDVTPDIFAIVFCRTKMETQDVAEHLIKDGYNADALHGDLSQAQRDKVMTRYRQRSLQLLIATDVAARGIDVSNVTHVVHYNLPDEIENYTHRSGRTGRAGKSGISVVIINVKEVYRIRQIEKIINKKFHLARVPGAVEVCESQLMGLVKKVHDIEINKKGIAKYLPSIFEELQDLDKEEVITRFISIEFNRFLDYYRNAKDINVNLSERDHTREAREQEKYRSGKPRMFINLGSMDGFETGRMLRYICDTTGMDKSVFGRIDIKGVYSFIDVEPAQLEQAVAAFENEVFKGRRVRADVSDGAGKKERSGGGGGGHKKSGGSYSKSNSGRSNRNSGDKKRYDKGGSGSFRSGKQSKKDKYRW